MDEGGDERRAQARHHEDGAGRAGGAEAALEPLLAAVAHALRRPPALDPALDDRVMAAVRATPIAAAGPAAGPAPAEAGEGRASPLARGWRWLRRPRTLRVSPLGGGLVGLAGLAAAAALTLMVSGGGEAPADGRLAAGDPAAATAAATAAPAAPDTVQVVQFVLVAPDARTVALVGDFNDWQVGATPLRPTASGRMWTVELPLAPGRHRYAFVLDDGRWVADPSAPRAPGADFGSPSSVVTVAERRS